MDGNNFGYDNEAATASSLVIHSIGIPVSNSFSFAGNYFPKSTRSHRL